jgi:uncharacterized membrane protein
MVAIWVYDYRKKGKGEEMKKFKITLGSLILIFVGTFLLYLFYTEQAEVLAMFRDFLIVLILVGMIVVTILDFKNDDKKEKK